MITVHHLNNSRSQRVLWLLEELELPYTIRRYQRDAKTMLAPPELKHVHPLGKSPVLTDDGIVVAESGAIIDYVTEKYGNGRLVPAAGTPERLRYTYWLHYAEGSAMLPLLPVDEEDPVEQLRLVHDRLNRAKASGQSQGGSAVVSAVKRVPFAFSAWMIRLLMRLPQRAVVALATNVPGPRGQQRLMGRRVLEVLPIPPIALRLRTGIAMVSYADTFAFGITADYDTAPDIEALASGIEDGVERLTRASRTQRHRRRGAPRPARAHRPAPGRRRRRGWPGCPRGAAAHDR